LSKSCQKVTNKLSIMFLENLSIICPFAQIVRRRRRRRKRRRRRLVAPRPGGDFVAPGKNNRVFFGQAVNMNSYFWSVDICISYMCTCSGWRTMTVYGRLRAAQKARCAIDWRGLNATLGHLRKSPVIRKREYAGILLHGVYWVSQKSWRGQWKTCKWINSPPMFLSLSLSLCLSYRVGAKLPKVWQDMLPNQMQRIESKTFRHSFANDIGDVCRSSRDVQKMNIQIWITDTNRVILDMIRLGSNSAEVMQPRD
jgi:hypothetical protein